MHIKILNWPNNNEAAFNLNFDDLSPFYFWGYDFGGNIQGKLFKQQMNLLSDSSLKITHFVVPKSNFFLPVNDKISRIINFPTNKFLLNNPKNEKWLGKIKELLSAGKIEIGIHGYTHFNNRLRKKHQEFLYDDYPLIEKKLLAAKQIFDAVEIPTFGFRPTGWGIDKKYDLLSVVKDLEIFDYIAASSLDAGLNLGKSRVNNFMPEWYNNILNIPQNLELDLSYGKLINQIDKIIEKNGLISLKGHFCNIKWIPNNFNLSNFEKLKQVVIYLKDYKIWYATFKEVSDYFKSISSAIISTNEDLSNNKKVIKITLPGKINGLTVLANNELKDAQIDTIIVNSPKVFLNNNGKKKIIFNCFSDNFILEISS